MADGNRLSERGRGSRPALVVSACLVGVPCNHLGRHSLSEAVVALEATYRLVPICPEVTGGLGIPRRAAARQPDGRVRTTAGDDVTEAYRRGAEAAVALAAEVGAAGAVLKARSPSCGCHEIDDGTFSGRLIEGLGTTAEALRAAGVPVLSEEDVGSPDDPGLR
jgi:uncharacterized protein YbbK (DUF523 family)